jgi:hypothetical protein
MAMIDRYLDIAVQLGTIGIVSFALRAEHWITIAGHGIASPALAQIELSTNLAVRLSLAVVICAALIRAGYDVWKLWVARMA